MTVSTPEECVDLGGKAVRIAGAAAGAQFSLAGQRVVKVFIEDCPDASVVLGDARPCSFAKRWLLGLDQRQWCRRW